MKLLILTQKIDRDDPGLGFFHKWVEKFSKQVSELIVVCLSVGDYHFSSNTKIHSLGKEKAYSKFKQLLNFYKYIWSERENYDTVFVHMNQEYVLLGFWIWKLMGKKVVMWRNHPNGTFLTTLAVYMSDKVFCTSASSYTAKFTKTKIMPAGVDTEIFNTNSINPKQNSILFFGRISIIKNVKTFVEALILLDKKNRDFTASIVGSPANIGDCDYEKEVHNLSKDLVERGKIKFVKGVKHDDSARIYAEHALYVNLTPSGSLDKTILEAMASERPILVLNRAFDNQIPEIHHIYDLDKKIISQKIDTILSLSEEEKHRLGKNNHRYALEVHDLNLLIGDLLTEMDKMNV